MRDCARFDSTTNIDLQHEYYEHLLIVSLLASIAFKYYTNASALCMFVFVYLLYSMSFLYLSTSSAFLNESTEVANPQYILCTYTGECCS